ncbi:MAG: hypothetical protein IK032_06885 [Bacteroidales bacterium]|nr:hypothetical protein [Bacteroidales bacterium]
MNKRHLLLAITMVLMSVATAFAQAPLSFTYQAVVRNSNGRLISNSNVGVKISILQGSSTGTAVYTNNYTPRTNANGLFSIVVGDSLNSIGAIDWAAGPYFLKSEVDPNGGNNYTIVSSQQMLSVPYALHAHTVDNVIGGVNFIERQVLSISNDTVFLTGGSFVKLPAGFSGNYNDLTNKPTNVSAFTNDAGYLTSFTETQVLSIRHDTVFLTGGSFVKLPAGFSGNYNDLTNKPTNVSAFTNDAGYLTSFTETQKLSDVAANNDSVNSQIKNLTDPTDSMDAVNLRTLNAVVSRYDSIIVNLVRVVDTLRNTHSIMTFPTVTTNVASSITNISAVSGGNVTNAGSSAVIARGVCWSTLPNPTISDNHITNGSGTGIFTSNLTGLTPGITYYVRAYATNSAGTAYGFQITFTSTVSTFSVSANTRIMFSPGNLQWSATNGGYTATNHTVTGGGTAAGTWRFAPNQWDTIGAGNSNISSSNSCWIDLFGWGTSGWDNGNYFYQPYSSSDSTSSPYTSYIGYGYGPTNGTSYGSSLVGSYSRADWGVYNAIYNPKTSITDAPGTWRTLTKDEWVYLLNTRSTKSGRRYAKATVNGVPGLIILPDNWNTATYTLNSTNINNAAYTTNVINLATWTILENAGCIFLPAAGHRIGTSPNDVGSIGSYWSVSSYVSIGYAYGLGFNSSGLDPDTWGFQRYGGNSVRLVRDVE